MAKAILTPESVLMRCKADRLETIQKMNVWGSELEDVRVLRGMPNLEIVSLSVNKISSLKDFQTCTKMKELYLRKNLIVDIAEIRYLQNMSALKVLWLLENPCAELPNYRLLVIKMLPSLEKLDNQAVTPEERSQASGLEEAPRGIRNSSPQRRDPPRPKTTETAARPPDRPAAFLERAAPEAEKPAGDRPGGVYQRPGSSGSSERPAAAPAARARSEPKPVEAKNENLMCAILALLKELDGPALEVVRSEVERRMAGRY